MASGSPFPPRPSPDEPSRDRGTKDERPCGWPSNGVGILKTSRDRNAREGFGPNESSGVGTREKLTGGVPRAPVPQTDTGGRGEQPQVNE